MKEMEENALDGFNVINELEQVSVFHPNDYFAF